MDENLLKVVAQVAGIGGVAIGALLLVFRDIIRKQIFPTLDRQRSYQLLLLISVLTWTVALAGIGAWIWVESGPGDMDPPRREMNADIHAEQSVVGVGDINVGTISIGVRNEPSAAKEQPSD